MTNISRMACIALSFLATPAIAQSDPVAAGAPRTAILRAGTSVPLRTLEGLSTEGKKLRVGQRFNLETAEPISLDGVVVIPVGSPAVGEVTDVRNKGMWGKSGRINARILYLRANGRQVRLSGSMDDKGVTGTAGVVGAVVLIPVAGFFMTGTSARIPAGSPATGFLEEDLPVAFATGATPQPMMVPAPTQAQAPTPQHK